ncbi:HindVP family restriction endonuclease [Methylotenera sp. N17]|uniref:HindVP family restriction endonuclease n=1 Tax=Methylotenera sp. N17 TaxID=1502761 RepID=UPI000648772D|nr:HindVP family restriction endonuclease [Methylotenera sp. N17]
MTEETVVVLPGLYGIKKSNRTGIHLWGKNQFNSTFPAALACWMRDQGLKPVYISLNPDLKTKVSDEKLTFDDVFNSKAPTEELDFHFETVYEPYKPYDFDKLDHIDLVVKKDKDYLRPLEVKLTVLPDNATEKKANQALWGAELVIRPDSTSYAALGIYHSLKSKSVEIRKILESAEQISDWENKAEIINHKDLIIDTLDIFQSKYCSYQQPFLMQPIWKTLGKSPELDDNAFDIFIWSDMALCRLIIDQAKNELIAEAKKLEKLKVKSAKTGVPIPKKSTKPEKVSRYLRASARLLRCLYDLFTKDKTHIDRIFRGMSLGNQTDKECSLNGGVTNTYMKHPRLLKPVIKKETLAKLIIGGGEKLLSPERRFDATIYFTAAHLFEVLETDYSKK